MATHITIQLRRDMAATWTARNPVLHEGELGYELDTGKAKMGDGSSGWTSLPYWQPGGGDVDNFDTAGSAAAAQSAAQTFATSAVATETARAQAAESTLLPKTGGTVSGNLLVNGHLNTANSTLDDGFGDLTTGGSVTVGSSVTVNGGFTVIKSPISGGALQIGGVGDGNQYSNFQLVDGVFPTDQNPGGHYWAFSHRVAGPHAFQVFNYNGAGAYTAVLQAYESGELDTVHNTLDDGTGKATFAGQVKTPLLDIDDGSTKQYNLRTDGSALDFEGAGQDIFFSVFQNYGRGGTQYNYVRMEHGTQLLHLIGKTFVASGPFASPNAAGSITLDPSNGLDVGSMKVTGMAAGSNANDGVAVGQTYIRRATTGLTGYNKINGTGTILSYTTPNDGQMHAIRILTFQHVTSTETGGAVAYSYFAPDGGSVSGVSLYASAQPTGFTTPQNVDRLVAPNTAITVNQTAALTAGATTLWVEIWTT